MRIEEIFKDYLLDVKITKSAGTYNFEESKINHFLDYLKNNNIKCISEKDLTKDLIINYIYFLKNTCKNNTINKHLNVIKRALKYNHISNNFLFELGKLREDHISFDMISTTNLARIINYLENNTINKNQLLYKAMIYLLIDSGVRSTELLLIEKNNVDLAKKRILLTHTKGRNERYIYLSNNLSYPLINQLYQEEHDHKYLFHNYIRNRKAEYNDLKYVCKYLKNELKFQKLHPHMFRHTMATLFLKNGASLPVVQKILGHNNMKTTSLYLHLDNDYISDEYIAKFNILDILNKNKKR